MTAWQVHTMAQGAHTIYIAYEYDRYGFTGLYGYVNGYGQIPTTILGQVRIR
jgi:hypothetical protein